MLDITFCTLQLFDLRRRIHHPPPSPPVAPFKKRESSRQRSPLIEPLRSLRLSFFPSPPHSEIFAISTIRRAILIESSDSCNHVVARETQFKGRKRIAINFVFTAPASSSSLSLSLSLSLSTLY